MENQVKRQRKINITNSPPAWGTPSRRGGRRRILHTFSDITQRSQIFALLQRKCPRKEIARIVGISQSTLSRELKRNSTRSGKYIWFKAHAKAVKRRKRSTRNAALALELVWRIKQLIIEEQW